MYLECINSHISDLWTVQLSTEAPGHGQISAVCLVAAAPFDLEGMVPYTIIPRMGCLGRMQYTVRIFKVFFR